MTYIAQLFVILAETKSGEARQVRRNRASAMCIADDWAEAGWGNVRIVDPDGIEHDRCQFRKTLTIVKQAKRRALALA